jgi:hypothetical protein
MDLLATASGRLPVVLELLRSPWVSRASELEQKGEATTVRQLEKPLHVVWDGERRAPVSFGLHDREYPVDALLQAWTVERWWWIPERRVSRRCFRVLARGGVYDLAFDRLGESWLLIGVVD